MRSSNKFDRRVDTAGAAAFLGVEVPTLVTWRCRKTYPLPYIKIGSRVFYDVQDLEEFVESRKVHPVALAPAREVR